MADPREYFRFLGQLDYVIPHLARPVFMQMIRARAETQRTPVTVLDLGSSYGVNGALLKYELDFEALRQRYTASALQSLTSDELLELDRAYFTAWPKHRHIRVIGLDISRSAVRYAEAVGAVDLGLAINLETDEPGAEQAEALSRVDLIISTGCVGYVSDKTFERVLKLTQRDRPAWVVSFVLRMFPYDQIAQTLAAHGLVTEKFEGATFVQRRFADREETEAAIAAVEGRGIDTRGHEADGLYHAELFVSRPPAEAERHPLHQAVSVVSGADKTWSVGTNVIGGFGKLARARAQAGRPRLTLA